MNWLHLPDNIWETILCNLSERDLLNASETCKKFNDLCLMSKKVLELLCLKIELFNTGSRQHNEKENLKAVRELKLLRKCLRKSQRKYSSIIISNLNNFFNHNDFKNIIYNIAFDILKQFAGSVTQLTFLNTTLQDDHFFEVIQTMKKLKVLKFENWDDKTNEVISENERLDDCDANALRIDSEIDEIYIKNVQHFKFPKLNMFDNLKILDVNYSWFSDFEAFEHLLSLQKSLKVLRLRKMSNVGFMFKTDKLSKDIKFSLDELTLNEVDWKNNENAGKFFKTQTNLKIVSLHFNKCIWTDLYMYGNKWYNELLVHLFGNNPHLKTVYFSIYDKSEHNIKDFSFLEGIVNHNVENLTLFLIFQQDPKDCLIAFAKLFPNVKKFAFTEENEHQSGFHLLYSTYWKSLESFYWSLYGAVFETPSYTFALCNGRSDILRMVEFLKRNQYITQLSIEPIYYHISDEDLILIVNSMKSLETLICDGEICHLSNYLEIDNPVIKRL